MYTGGQQFPQWPQWPDPRSSQGPVTYDEGEVGPAEQDQVAPNKEIGRPWYGPGNWQPDVSESPYGGSGGSLFAGGMGLGGMDPMMAGMMGLRGTAGTGGGSEASEGNMDANELIALSEFLGENVTSFDRGGRVRSPYYDHGGMYGQQDNEMIAINQIANLLGGVNSPYDNKSQWAENNFIRDSRGMMQFIGDSKLSFNDATNPKRQLSLANQGMKMRKRYTQGGRF